MRMMSLWLIMSLQSRKWNEERWMLMWAMTLGESDPSEGILANDNQFGWWVVPIRVSPLQSKKLGILQISDQGDSWMKTMSNWL